MKKESVVEIEKSPVSSRKLLKTAFPMMLSTSVILIMSWIDTIILGIYTTEFDIGVYNVVVKSSSQNISNCFLCKPI